MIFEWSDDKRRKNLLKHGFDFADVAAVFARDMLTGADDRFDYAEPRTCGIGLLEGRVVTVVFVETGETIRIISLRKASEREQEAYFDCLGHRLEAY